ncbi:MAG TPA: hypothetical protein VGB89_05300 [Bacteroidota bacterium]|jgi:Spy/CpxP family protein refolding chaperone
MKILSSLFILKVVVCVIPLSAQPMGNEHQMQRIEQFKKLKLIELLDMKEEQSVRFFTRMHEFEKKKQEIMKQKDDLLDKIERILRNRGDETELRATFQEIEEREKKILQEELTFYHNLEDILTVEQRGKLFLFERQFHRELREAMREMQGRRQRPF